MLKNLLYFAILTTVIVISWITFGIYHNNITSTISPDTSIRISPIPANFDIETITNLKSKEVIQADLFAGPASSISGTTNIPKITSTPTSTTSGKVTGGAL